MIGSADLMDDSALSFTKKYVLKLIILLLVYQQMVVKQKAKIDKI